MGGSEQMSRLLCFIYFLLLGDFLPCAAGIFKDICIDSEMEVFSHHGAMMEPHERSHVDILMLDPSLPARKPNWADKFQIKLEFNTTNPNGILFYGRSRGEDGRNATPFGQMSLQDELIAFTLIDGDLYYTINCPSLAATLYIPTKDRKSLNDGKWHRLEYTVSYKPRGQSGSVLIDGIEYAEPYEVTCKRMTTIVIGGRSPKDTRFTKELVTEPGYFNGCIRNSVLPSPLERRPKYYVVSVC